MGLETSQQAYGDSWIARGLTGAYFVMIRKADRIENQMRAAGYDLPKALKMFPGKDGIMDDFRDLRRYLLLIEAEVISLEAEDGAEPGAGYVNQAQD